MSNRASRFPHASSRAAGAVLCALALSVGVAIGAPPTPQVCDDQDLGDRVMCKFGNILAQQESAVGTLNDMPEVPQDRKQVLMDLTQRAMRAHGRSTSGDFLQLAKKRDPQCQVVEIANDGKGDDDGICKGNEDCLEVVGDQIGDDIQPCRLRGNPNEREVCVEICDNEAIASNPDNFDESGRGQEIEEELDEVTEQYMVLNEMLEDSLTLRQAAGIMAANGDPCGRVFGDRINGTVISIALGAKLVMETATDAHDKFCNQDVSGFNGATACAIIEVIKGALIATFETLDFIDGNRDSDTIDTTFECLKQLNTSVGEGNAAIESIETKVDALDQQVKTLQQRLDEVMNLLVTPQGLRTGFPSRD